MKKKFVTLLSVVAVFAGCATVPSEDGVDSKAAVAKMASARWQALIQGNLDEAYTFISPASKDVLPLERYKAGIKPGIWKRVEVSEVTCSAEDVCEARVVVFYHPNLKGLPVGALASREVTETWRQASGKWWFVPDR